MSVIEGINLTERETKRTIKAHQHLNEYEHAIADLFDKEINKDEINTSRGVIKYLSNKLEGSK